MAGNVSLIGGHIDPVETSANDEFVKVVRCKDCNKAQYKNDSKKTLWCFLHKHERKYDDFCSFGMRCKTE